MCGIVGFIGYFEGFDYAINGLRMLLNRGYDSCGCVGIIDDKLVVHKYANTDNTNPFNLLESQKKIFNCSYALAFHTRWAVTGSVTATNAHPHVDYQNKIALVHNGIIENYHELKQELEKTYNIKFKSQTDTEVIVNLISIYYEQNGNHMEEAIVQATERLEGTWALVIMCLDKPNNLYCARHGSPLLIGFGGNFMMVASEQSGFAGYVNNYICMNDGDVIVLKKIDGQVDFKKKSKYQMKNINAKEFVLTPEPYPHWTIKEINDQYESSARAINFGGRLLDDDKVKLGGIDNYKDTLLKTDHLILVGCGTSLHACYHAANFFKELTDLQTVQSIDGGELTEYDIPKKGKTTLVLLSQSGESADVYRCLQLAKNHNLFTVGIVNVVDSLIAREVDCGCYLNAGREVAVASTKAFTSQVIVLSLLAIWFAQNKDINDLKRKKYIKDLRQLPHDIKKTIKETEDSCKEIAQFLLDKQSAFVLGKGKMEFIAKEGALKIKEIGYLHTEGYSAVALKHGPFALLQSNTPVIFVNPDDENTIRVNSSIEEVNSRLAPIILISNKKSYLNPKYTVIVPTNNTYSGLIHVIPMQLIAYYLSVYRNNNPDMPRNLAKAVTVF